MIKLGKEKGITLVSFVITIVVIAILATVTIKVSLNKGIIENTKKATDEFKEASIMQIFNTILTSERSLYENGFISKQKMFDHMVTAINNNEDLKQYSSTITVNKDDEGNTKELTINLGEEYGLYKITEEKVEKVVTKE